MGIWSHWLRKIAPPRGPYMFPHGKRVSCHLPSRLPCLPPDSCPVPSRGFVVYVGGYSSRQDARKPTVFDSLISPNYTDLNLKSDKLPYTSVHSPHLSTALTLSLSDLFIYKVKPTSLSRITSLVLLCACFKLSPGRGTASNRRFQSIEDITATNSTCENFRPGHTRGPSPQGM